MINLIYNITKYISTVNYHETKEPVYTNILSELKSIRPR